MFAFDAGRTMDVYATIRESPQGDAMLVQTASTPWKPSAHAGVAVKVLRRDKSTGESTSLVRFEPGTRFPAHNHPAGEEIFVLEGDFTVGAHRMVSGDYLYTAPNEKHAASTEGGCLVLVTLPKPVEIL
jgi:quercetin dioxygenase-like cupin family protein